MVYVLKTSDACFKMMNYQMRKKTVAFMIRTKMHLLAPLFVCYFLIAKNTREKNENKNYVEKKIESVFINTINMYESKHENH